MATEFLVKLADRPGQLATLATALSDGGVNIKAMAGNKGVVGIVVSDADTARTRRALKKAKYRATERKAIEVRLKDQPGSLQRVATRFGRGKVNIASAYVLAPGRGNVTVAFGVKDARKANKALGR